MTNPWFISHSYCFLQHKKLKVCCYDPAIGMCPLFFINIEGNLLLLCEVGVKTTGHLQFLFFVARFNGSDPVSVGLFTLFEGGV